MGHSEIGVTMNVYGHLVQDKQGQLTNDLDALVERTRRRGDDGIATASELVIKQFIAPTE
jgi:hypothetical protein